MALPLSYLDLPGANNVNHIALRLKVTNNIKIEAIRIACDGELQDPRMPKVSVIEISPTDPVFTAPPEQISKIFQLIGIPIAGRKLLAPHEQPMELNPSNSEATMLFLNVDLNARGSYYDDEDEDGNFAFCDPLDVWGFAPSYWQFSVGPVVIARLDKKPLHPLHASALIKFCRSHISGRVLGVLMMFDCS